MRFIHKVKEWHKTHAPDLPWRATKNPYHILVSEVMLQQTQIPRVLIKYPLFLKNFPNVQALASASLQHILAVWSGMGYNRRALFLRNAAEIIIRVHGDKVPKGIAALDALPGIGPYSARAITCFAYGICEPFVETNIRRAIIHEFFPRKKNITDKEILQMLQHIQPPDSSIQREWYWALMDYGRDALQKVPNANRRSKHYVKQSRFEGSSRYVRAKIISYLLENKKATEDELIQSLKKNRGAIILALANLEREKLIRRSRVFFRIA